MPIFKPLNKPVGEHTERPLVKVHDGIVHSLVAVHYGVGVKSDNQVISEFGTLLQEVLK